MKKHYSNKELHSELQKEPTEVKPKTLVCIRECVAPGYGHWKAGEEVTAPDLVERFASNPNFVNKEDKCTA
jgi:hypothetical protein